MRLRLLTIALLISATVGAAEHTDSPSKIEAKNEEKTTNNQPANSKGDNIRQPPVIIINNPPATAHNAQASQNPEQSQIKMSDLGTWVLALLAIGISIFALRANQQLVELERPWINVKPIPQDPLDWPYTQNGPPVTVPFTPSLKWTARNSGRSLGFLTDLSINFRCLPLPIVNQRPAYDKFADFSKMIIDANGGSHDSVCYLDKPIDQGELDAILSGQKCIAFYGYATYFDTITKKKHKTRFFCYWRIPNSALPWMLTYIPVGPRKTVKYT